MIPQEGDQFRSVASTGFVLVMAGRRLVGAQQHEHPVAITLVPDGAALYAAPHGLDADAQRYHRLGRGSAASSRRPVARCSVLFHAGSTSHRLAPA